ncbi:MAG: acetyl-CoA synthetase [Betaproteobacteria bacterium]|nr:acetyl-CoA synthetase [Betaproteobacteria bacterium]
MSAIKARAATPAVPEPEPRGYPGNLGLLFASHAQSGRTAIVDLYDPAKPREISYRELDAMCDGVAGGCVRAGLKAGDRIGIVSLNRIEFIATLLGCMRVGVVPVPVNVKLTADAIAFILKDAGAHIVFTEPPLRKLCPDDVRIVEYGGERNDSYSQFADATAYTPFEPAPDSIAVQPYTSGSTGRPKGVLLTHYGQNWSRRVLAWSRRTTPEDAILVAAPLYHKNALNAIKQGLTAGAKLPLLPQFDAERYIDAIGAYRCTVISGVPTMTSMVLAKKDRLAATDVSSVHTVMMGSALASRQIFDELHQYFPNAEALVVYGVTEGGPVPLGPHPQGKSRPQGSVGVPYKGTGAELIGGINPDEGELILKNPGVLLAYHNLPDETAKRIRNGWYHTSDICRRDADGFYYFVGRTDDMFVCGGENVFPIEVVSLLESHPAVQQAVVLPFEHEMKGQVPYAFVVLRAGHGATEDELKQFTLEHGPAFRHPRRIFFLERMPLAGTNKIDQQALRRIGSAQTLNAGTTGASHG